MILCLTSVLVLSCITLQAAKNETKENSFPVDDFFHDLEDLTGCFEKHPKKFQEFTKFLPPESEDYGWSGATGGSDLPGESYRLEFFKIKKPQVLSQESGQFFEYEVFFELLMEAPTGSSESYLEKKVFSARVYIQPSNIYTNKFYLQSSRIGTELPCDE